MLGLLLTLSKYVSLLIFGSLAVSLSWQLACNFNSFHAIHHEHDVFYRLLNLIAFSQSTGELFRSLFGFQWTSNSDPLGAFSLCAVVVATCRFNSFSCNTPWEQLVSLHNRPRITLYPCTMDLSQCSFGCQRTRNGACPWRLQSVHAISTATHAICHGLLHLYAFLTTTASLLVRPHESWIHVALVLKGQEITIPSFFACLLSLLRTISTAFPVIHHGRSNCFTA